MASTQRVRQEAQGSNTGNSQRESDPIPHISFSSKFGPGPGLLAGARRVLVNRESGPSVADLVMIPGVMKMMKMVVMVVGSSRLSHLSPQQVVVARGPAEEKNRIKLTQGEVTMNVFAESESNPRIRRLLHY